MIGYGCFWEAEEVILESRFMMDDMIKDLPQLQFISLTRNSFSKTTSISLKSWVIQWCL